MIWRQVLTIGHGLCIIWLKGEERPVARDGEDANPSPQFAYVGSRTSRHREGKGTGIEVFQVTGPEERWTKVQTLPMANPTYLTFSPSRRRIYSAHGDATTVRVLEIDPLEGTLTLVNEVDSGGENPVHLAVSPDERFLLIANHNSGTVASLPILADEDLGAPISVLELFGELGPHRRDQNGPKPHQIVFDPTGNFLLVPDKGMDSIFVLELDADGTLTMDPGRTTRLREMSGPRHLVLHPSGTRAYSLEEFRSTVTRYDWDATRGRLSLRQVVPSTPEEMTADSRAGEIAIDAQGRHVYVSNRGGPGDASPGGFTPDTIGVFTVDNEGRLVRPHWTETIGIRPRFFCFDPTGTKLLVAHERGHSIAVHDVDPDSGDLAPGRILATTGSPVFILRHDLGPAERRP
jgi:6-phosphogluconolactonase